MEGSRFCAGCGREIEPGITACLYCGRRVPGESEQVSPPVPDPPACMYSDAPAAGLPVDSPAVGTGEWFVTLLLLGIPLVNLVLLLVWAFGGSANPSKRNFSKAVLAFVLIAFVVWLASFAAGIAILGRNPDLERRILEMLGEMVPG